ncbi:dermonecrotic toxin [Pseudomonas sp. DD1]|uniref:dermonecrotic toxin domain-containing protein n=1 Tax=Pseudomonas sp. DD1 TaxID=879558 RepID=UPI0037C8F4AE
MTLSVQNFAVPAYRSFASDDESSPMKSASNPQATTVAGNSALDNRNALILTLAGLEQGLATGRISNEHILPALQAAKIQLAPDAQHPGPTMEVSLAQYITANGWSIPQNREGLIQLRQTVSALAPTSPSNAYAVITERAAKANVEKTKFKKIVLDTAVAFPDVRKEAKKRAEEIVFGLTGIHVDADKTYLNRFNSSQSGQTATGWEHMKEEPSSSISLTDAVLKNFSEYDGIPGTLDSEAGLYKDGPGQSAKAGYGAHNEIPLAPSAFMKALWKSDFQTTMSAKIDSFWKDHADGYRTVQKGIFIYRAGEQLKAQEAKLPAERALQPPEHQLTRSDYKRLMKAVTGAEIAEDQPMTVEKLQATSPVTGDVQVHAFDINGFQSSDILRFTLPAEGLQKDASGRLDGVQILYIPDAKPAFLKFASLEKMDQWVSDQGKTPQTRKALESHFSLADRQNSESGGFGTAFFNAIVPLGSLISEIRPKNGVDSSLEYLSTDSVSNQEGNVIDRSNIAIKGDVFSHMADSGQQRMRNDADTAIKSNSEVTRDTWLNDISVGAELLVKLAPLAAPVAAAAVITSLTEVVLGTEKEISGDTQAERHDGASKTFDGMINTLFSSAGLSSNAADPFALPKEEPLAPEPSVESASEPAPDSPYVDADVSNRLQPSQTDNISAYAIADGESLLAKSTVNARGIYQYKNEAGVDRWFIRYTDQSGIAKTYEIKGDFKLSDGYVQIIDPQTGKPVLTVETGADNQWRASKMLGGNRKGKGVNAAREQPAGQGPLASSSATNQPLANHQDWQSIVDSGTYNGKPVYIHYTSKAGAEAIARERSINDLARGERRAGSKGGVYVNPPGQQFNSENVENLLFLGNERYVGSGDYMVIFSSDQVPTDLGPVTAGSQFVELKMAKEIKLTPSNFLYLGPNNFKDYFE